MGLFTKYLVVAFLFVSCGVQKQASWTEESKKQKVLATTPIVASLIKKIGGNDIDVISLMGEDLDPHSYEIVKGDSEKIAKAELIVANGLSLEHSASVRYQLEQHPNVLYLGDELKEKYPNEIIYVNKQADPHIWLDIRLWAMGVDPIVERLSKLDPTHAADYTKRGKGATEALLAKDQEMRETLQRIPDSRRYLVTAHDAFQYFGRRYLGGEPRVIAIQGIAPDEQISSMEIAKVVDYVMQHNIRVLFPEVNLNADPLKKVAEACRKKGRDVKLAKDGLYSDTMGGRSYLEMMDHNMTVLKDNL